MKNNENVHRPKLNGTKDSERNGEQKAGKKPHRI